MNWLNGIGDWFGNTWHAFRNFDRLDDEWMNRTEGFDIDQLLEKQAQGIYFKQWSEFRCDYILAGVPVYPIEEYNKLIQTGEINPKEYGLDNFINDMGPVWEILEGNTTNQEKIDRVVYPIAITLMAQEGISLAKSGLDYAKYIKSSNEIRKKVLLNIQESQAARASSNFKIYAAKEAQIIGNYLPDRYSMVIIPKGSIVYGGLPEQSTFYTDFNSVKASGLNKSVLWEGLQVRPHKYWGHRLQIGAYRVLKDLRVPFGQALANSGKGGFVQYYISDFKSSLELIRIFNLK